MSELSKKIIDVASKSGADKWEETILEVNIEGLIRSALIDQKFEIIEEIKSVHNQDAALDVVRAYHHEI